MASPSTRAPSASRLEQNILLRVAVYYLVLFGAAFMAWRYLPDSMLPHQTLDSLISAPSDINVIPSKKHPGGPAFSGTQATLTANVAVAMIAALLLILPIAWVYILTRHKNGYQQSVVQTLVILAPVVAGVVVMVKYSLPLAFGLAGIVAAIRFRNTLDDSKDAVYVFLATTVGLAAGVELPVAAVISLIFNALILFLWFTDFGRSPAPLEGGRGQKKIERAMAEMRRTGSFVAMLDEQIFRDMSPEQLELAADRAWRRKRRQSTDAPTADDMQRRDVMLRIQCDEAEGARPAVESAFEEYLKKWRLGGIVRDTEGGQSLEYIVQFKKSAEPDDLMNELRTQQHVLSVEVK
ncbi:MAG: DUF4956 domain-containing protein [Gemmatimonadaceae bacterium]|nr:DUF4956 domain-containing protein [Gemmatimonadaceae bacterium]